MAFALGRFGIGPDPVTRSHIKCRGMTGIRNFYDTLLTVIRDNCRGCHSIQAALADVFINFAQDDSTVRLSHMNF